jgi:hypothetical protein
MGRPRWGRRSAGQIRDRPRARRVVATAGLWEPIATFHDGQRVEWSRAEGSRSPCMGWAKLRASSHFGPPPVRPHPDTLSPPPSSHAPLAPKRQHAATHTHWGAPGPPAEPWTGMWAKLGHLVLQRGRAPSGAPGLAVQLGRGPHGQCPTQLHGEAPAAGYELLVADGLQQHAPPAAGRRSGPGMGAGRMGHGGAWSACATKQGSGCIPRLLHPPSCRQRPRTARVEAGQGRWPQEPTFPTLSRLRPDEEPRQAAQEPRREASSCGAAAEAPPAPELGDSSGRPARSAGL